ncbi:MAG TPA: LysR family transcriptional regulator [Thermomicrobiales bacterium]|nr:LysR family transcriptional regulator [Thermomicrobiales bacterium]
MDVRQLRCLVAIVDEGGFSSAARRLEMTQPAVSLQIARLEREIGNAVFLRNGRQVSLTATGEILLPHARKAVRAFDDAQVAARLTQGVVSGSILMGTVPGCGGANVPDLLRDFRKAFPDVSMRVIEGSADDLIRRVTNEDVDIAIVGTTSPSSHGLPSRIITETRLIAVAPREHGFARKSAIPLRALLEETVMCTPEGSGIRAALDMARKPARLDLSIRYESGNPDVLIRFAAVGLGIAIVPDGPELHTREDVAAIEITDPLIWGRLEMIWSRQSETSPAVRELIRLAEML